MNVKYVGMHLLIMKLMIYEELSFPLKHMYETDVNMFGGLVNPMLAYTIQLEDHFKAYFKKLNETAGICNDLLHFLKTADLQGPCERFEFHYLIKLFIRMRIYYCLKFTNRDLASSKRKNRKYPKIVHL